MQNLKTELTNNNQDEWEQTKLSDVGQIVTGNTPPTSNPNYYNDNFLPWVTPPDLGEGTRVKTTKRYLSKEGASVARVLPKGAVMISCIGNLGKVGIAETELATNQQINSIVFNDKVLPEYGFYYCLTLKEWLQENSSATTISIVNKGRLENAPFLLTPIKSQQQIINHLNNIFPLIPKVTNNIVKARKLVKKFRQAVLYAAITGKFSEEWRIENKITNDLPNTYKTVQFKASDIDGWVQTKVKNIYTSFGGGTPSRGNSDNWGGNVSWVSSGDVKEDFISTGSESITQAGLESSSAKLCPIGSIIVVVRSGILKHTLPVAIVQKPLAINQDIKCFDSNDSRLNKWLFLFLKGMANDILALNREGTTVQSVKYETLRDLDIEFPPAEEQKVIEKRVTEYLKIADQLEKQIEKAEASVGRLTQSVLAKTFKNNSD